ncbi:nicotinate-nucleotide--dimethylbenzimidazole phosphoribosyltransferase [Trinickia caryophylli]|uniref:Nicotinate-nucleotide--dimethylbenzimidazole phosphoribosyltransferase n=1 Tax=Trinickia caryophylli TaxID=28094 RepID=A0A1X7GYH7_TRICW|nr:nicotinate-nucleotide--dimethylbenzimidazole phosphoribosyltransferase [Trinickia caryophylli]PMS10158.1 nicotinate-nucleotide--dimethylbenzimidazole phosphoribosyltransferase [Trinickia caryophylli]TRX18258.1 nicotinate-nucleotide--dimethylbenzimidazole phosphoribosyltransferase [Trinickia caryophylli]WQE10956.1 nicotinate-nucleotide--dimethylbenzimidazole phosphoribosyltransferase [Trinickia caryophylli]SMF76248.1 nicotinate-nucleotide-dimethylbenzimidazole phosphoribosyltransferase [Trini
MNAPLPLPVVEPLDASLRDTLTHIIDTKTKPQGSLGTLETLARQIGMIQRSTRPSIDRPAMIVFAADHGIAHEGVSPYPQAVTAQMVANFLAGGAAINAFSRVAGLTLEIVNAGVAMPLGTLAGLVDIPVGPGTRSFARECAMTRDEAHLALAAGAARVRHHAALGTNVIGFGEMGIGNTSSAACLMSRLLGVPIDECVGRGTGLDNAGLARKRNVLVSALARHASATEPLDVLAAFGGFEIAMMVGAYLAAAQMKMTILVDGFIATAALVVADALAPAVRDYCIFAHLSNEAGHRRMLDYFGAKPLLALDLRLGEGTGAALALPVLRAAVAFLNDMASFESAGVAGRESLETR